MTIPQWRLITISQRLITRRGGEINCNKCNHELEEGMKAWSHTVDRKRIHSYCNYFCPICYDRMWV